MKKKGAQKKRQATETLFGVNPIHEALKAGKRKFFGIVIKRGVAGSKPIEAIIRIAEQRGIRIESTDIETIAKRANAEGHQGILASVTPLPHSSLDRLIERTISKKMKGLAILDGVQDPRNFGAIIRSAEAFGMGGVIFQDRRAASYTPVAAKSSAGAGEHLPLCAVTNIAETIRRLKTEGFFCIGFDGDAKEIFNTPPSPVAIVMGGEGTGIRPLVQKRCDTMAKIPITGQVGSLNVSAAAAIAFYIATSR